MITFQTAEKEHLPGVVRLANYAFGEGYLTEELAEAYSDFLVAIEDHMVVGYTLNLIEDNRGNISQIAVNPAYRHKGLGTELVKRSVEILHAYGVGIVDSQAWERSTDKVVPLAKALEANGFTRIEYLPHFYNEDHSEDAPCNICGDVCVCGAWQYERILVNT